MARLIRHLTRLGPTFHPPCSTPAPWHRTGKSTRPENSTLSAASLREELCDSIPTDRSIGRSTQGRAPETESFLTWLCSRMAKSLWPALLAVLEIPPLL